MKESARCGEWTNQDDYDGWSVTSDQVNSENQNQMDESSAWDEDDVNIDIHDNEEAVSTLHASPSSETETEELNDSESELLQKPSTSRREIKAYHRKRNRGRRRDADDESPVKELDMSPESQASFSSEDFPTQRFSPVKHDAPVEKTGVAVELLGYDLSSLSPRVQFATCASGNLALTLVYGYLQEMLSVHVFHREYPLFFATCQFGIYAAWAWYLRLMSNLPSGDIEMTVKCAGNAYPSLRAKNSCEDLSDVDDDSLLHSEADNEEGSLSTSETFSNESSDSGDDKSMSRPIFRNSETVNAKYSDKASLKRSDSFLQFVKRNMASLIGLNGKGALRNSLQQKQRGIPMSHYIGLSILRSVDLACTNLAMRYVNYPAKTLVKSSRVAFTMFMGIFIGRKRYSWRDYAVVGLLVSGLLVFFDADSKVDSATFHPVGIALLVLSLICDGAVSNCSEQLMNVHDVSQDEFLFHLYFISFGMLFLASQRDGEFWSGLKFMLQPGTVDEWKNSNMNLHSADLVAIANDEDFAGMSHAGVWTSAAKISALLLFGTTGMLGSSCASAITKHFGALSMSITSTARKGLTLFLSFALFPNACTFEHGAGIGLFMTSLAMKSCLRAGSTQSAKPQRGGV